MAELVPYITIRHGDDSLTFLQEGLGFVVTTDQRGDANEVVHVELVRGTAVVMGGAGDASAAQSPGLYLVVDDVPAVHAKVLGLGATEVYPPEQTEWGTWRSRFVDLDGHEWTVGTYEPGQSW